MRYTYILFLFITLLFFTNCENNSTSKTDYAPELSTQLDTISYLFGFRDGNDFKQRGIEDIDYEIFLGAMNEALAGEESKVNMQDGSRVYQEYMAVVREKVRKEKEAEGKINIQEANDFLAKNKEKEGVITTESGLQYEILAEGEGESPQLTDRVLAHYVGTYQDGEVFESSRENGQPATFAVNGVVRGWTEALQLMKPGAKYKLYIPPSLGYGQFGKGDIGPNKLLIFELELLEVIPNPNAAN